MEQWEKDIRERLERELPDGPYNISSGDFRVFTGKVGKIEYEVALERLLRDQVKEFKSVLMFDTKYVFPKVEFISQPIEDKIHYKMSTYVRRVHEGKGYLIPVVVRRAETVEDHSVVLAAQKMMSELNHKVIDAMHLLDIKYVIGSIDFDGVTITIEANDDNCKEIEYYERIIRSRGTTETEVSSV